MSIELIDVFGLNFIFEREISMWKLFSIFSIKLLCACEMHFLSQKMNIWTTLYFLFVDECFPILFSRSLTRFSRISILKFSSKWPSFVDFLLFFCCCYTHISFLWLNFNETVRLSRIQLDYFWQRLSWVWRSNRTWSSIVILWLLWKYWHLFFFVVVYTNKK